MVTASNTSVAVDFVPIELLRQHYERQRCTDRAPSKGAARAS
jgi:hypothetical protein